MKPIRILAVLALITGVAACATPETVSRSVVLDNVSAPTINAASAAPTLNVTELVVEVPRALRVSEANLFYPGGDIVWREDPPGDRHEQVKAIFEAGMEKGLAGLPQGDMPVRMHVEVTRFHALSEKARYTVGGVHAVQFLLTLQDPETGRALSEPRLIKADFRAYGGRTALEAEARGETQKFRITRRLASVIQHEMLAPGSTSTAGLGLVGALNQL